MIKIEEIRNFLGTELEFAKGKLHLCGCEIIDNDLRVSFTESRDNYPLSNFYPSVRPLSQLTEEITHNGEKIVPIVELMKMTFDERYLTDFQSHDIRSEYNSYIVYFKLWRIDFTFGYTPRMFRFVKTKKGVNVAIPSQIQMFQKLFEWHFDIFGWIEKDLAIEKK